MRRKRRGDARNLPRIRPRRRTVENVVGADRRERDPTPVADGSDTIDRQRVDGKRAFGLRFAYVYVVECGAVHDQLRLRRIDCVLDTARVLEFELLVRRRDDGVRGPAGANLGAELTRSADQENPHARPRPKP